MRSRRDEKNRGRFVETLESRRLLSGAQIDFANFASTTGLVANGYGSAATANHHALQLTDGVTEEARSDLYGTKVPTATFTSHFSFQISAGQPGVDGTEEADGFTFVIDNGTAHDLGLSGFDLGYASGTFGAHSVALEFNTYNFGAFGSTFAFASGGVVPSSPQNTTPVDFHIGDQISATVTYDGTHLSVNLIDNVSHVTFSDSEAINLSSVLGGNAAYVGFTGATGNDDSVQKIDNWDFTGTGVAPTITVAAASSPVPVTGTKAHLTVTAESNSAGTLSYAWSILHQPPGAAVPTFKPNSSTSSAASSVHFFKAGTYVFRVTVTDSNGGSSVSDVLVVVQQTPTQIKVTPHKAQIVEGTTQQFNGAVFDQFGHTFQTQPAITYGVSGAGGGTIIATSGLYTAGDTIGHLVITATADELTGVAGATVIS